MEVKRRFQKNKILADIKSTKILLERSANTIKSIKNSTMGLDYISGQIVKLTHNIQEKTDYLENLKKELISIESGARDDQINNLLTLEKIKNDKNREEKISEKIKEKKNVEEKNEISRVYMKNIITDSKNFKQSQRDVSYSYKYFNKVSSELPDYMIKNLSEMPNNKGYIWRGVNFYGDLKSQLGPVVMFEKQGNILVIHEYTPTDYKRFEKNGKDRKILIYSEKRRIKQFGTNIMDYYKTAAPDPAPV